MTGALIRRGLVVGVAYGLAVTAIEGWFGTLKFIEFGMPALPEATMIASALEIAIGAVLGALAAPALRLRRGTLAHVAALATTWTVLERVVAPDPSLVRAWAMGPLGGLVLLGLGAWVARWRRVLPWAVGAIAVIGTIVAPIVVEHRRTRGMAEHLPPAAARAEAPDVVMVVLDTVRARSASAYGYARPTTPTLARLATEGALFLDATAPSTWSLPSHASLFTGWFPSAHGAHAEHRSLGMAPPTLAEVLARAGYDTRCFTANPHISASFGLTRGFRWSDQAFLSGVLGRSFFFPYRVLDLLGLGARDKGGADVARHFEEWAAKRPAGDAPAFAFINFLEAHFPYHQVPDEFVARFTDRSRRERRAVSLEVFGAQFGRALTPDEAAAAVAPSIDMYDAGVLYSDYLLSRVVEALRASGRLDRTVLVVLADHGEMVGEHGAFGHGLALYEPDVRVPLLFRYPPRVRARTRVATPVSTLGVFSTVLELTGTPAPGPVHVGSLLPALDGGTAGAPVIVERFAQPEAGVAGTDALEMRDRRYRTYRSGALKLVETSHGDTFLFDLASDPEEDHDVAASRPADVKRLRDELAAWTTTLRMPALDAPVAAVAASETDAATRERLKALGYVQ